ncbi:MAG: hypothetical protein JWM86_1702 [Thermoleophilia bacterium]|nr:hypothetical protein [Thermoleophilia bacterium]
MRAVLALLLALVAGALVAGGVVAGDARATLLETDRWVEVTTPVLEQQPVREELATLLVDGVAARLACRGTIGSLFAASLAVEQAKRLLVGRIDTALGSARVRRAWAETNRTAHERFVRAARLDRSASEDRLLDVSLLLDSIGSVIDGKSTGSREGIDEACQVTEDPSVEVVDDSSLHRAADAARVLHRVRSAPEVLVVAAVILFLLSLAFVRPVTSIFGLGLGAATVGLGIWISDDGILEGVSSKVSEGSGGVLARAISEAALTPVFEHQLVVGMSGFGVMCLAAAIAIIRRARRPRPAR